MLATRTTASEANWDDVEAHRNAYNAAFYELGLKWHWDAHTYQSLLPKSNEKKRIQFYLENHHPHLLSAYDADFIVEAIESTKQRCFNSMAECGKSSTQSINWAELHHGEIGI